MKMADGLAFYLEIHRDNLMILMQLVVVVVVNQQT